MSRPQPRRRRLGTGVVAALVLLIVSVQLWSADADGGTGAVIAIGLVVVVVGGGLALLVWQQYRVSGERMAATARGMGFMAGSVWYTSARRTEDQRQGLLVVRRDGLAWLPVGLDPAGLRDIPLGSLSVLVDEPGKQVTVASLGSFRAHSVKGLHAALEAVGAPTG